MRRGEVEHTTSIYSGIVRPLDLALGAPGRAFGTFLDVCLCCGSGDTFTVGTDEVVYTQRVTAVAGQTSSLEVVAIRPSGTVAWTAKLDGGVSRLGLSGNLVLVASGNGDMGMNGGTQSADDKS